MKPGHIVVSSLVAVLGLAMFLAQDWLDQRSHSNPAPGVAEMEAATPRRITMKDLDPAFEIYSNAKKGEGEGDAAVDHLGAQFGKYCGELGGVHYLVLCRFEFHQAIGTGAVPFDPNGRVGVIRGPSREEYDGPNLNGAGESEEKTGVELLAKKVEETFRAMMERLWDAPGWPIASQPSTYSD